MDHEVDGQSWRTISPSKFQTRKIRGQVLKQFGHNYQLLLDNHEVGSKSNYNKALVPVGIVDREKIANLCDKITHYLWSDVTLMTRRTDRMCRTTTITVNKRPRPRTAVPQTILLRKDEKHKAKYRCDLFFTQCPSYLLILLAYLATKHWKFSQQSSFFQMPFTFTMLSNKYV